MAITALHPESAQANPIDPRITNALEHFEERADQISALAYTLAETGGLDPMVAASLRGLGRLAAHLSDDIIDSREVLAA